MKTVIAVSNCEKEWLAVASRFFDHFQAKDQTKPNHHRQQPN
jgi:hypothetical protein